MHHLKILREQLGFSQRQFAGLLGISNGLIALVETGKRPLPENARQMVWQLDRIVPLLPVFDPEAPLETDEPSRNQLARKIRDLTRQVNKNRLLLERLLEKMEKLKRISAFGARPEAETLWPEGSIEKQEWNLLLRKSNKKNSTLTIQIILLKISISGREAELEMARSEKF